MVEQYVIEELKALKKENEELKEKLSIEKNNRIRMIDQDPVYVALKSRDRIERFLEEESKDAYNLKEELGSQDLAKIIKDFELYIVNPPKSGDKGEGIVSYNGKYYKLEKNYSREYKLEEEVFIDLDEAIYCELVDKFYDMLVNIDYAKKEKEKKEKENK